MWWFCFIWCWLVNVVLSTHSLLRVTQIEADNTNFTSVSRYLDSTSQIFLYHCNLPIQYNTHRSLHLKDEESLRRCIPPVALQPRSNTLDTPDIPTTEISGKVFQLRDLDSGEHSISPPPPTHKSTEHSYKSSHKIHHKDFSNLLVNRHGIYTKESTIPRVFPFNSMSRNTFLSKALEKKVEAHFFDFPVSWLQETFLRLQKPRLIPTLT